MRQGFHFVPVKHIEDTETLRPLLPLSPLPPPLPKAKLLPLSESVIAVSLRSLPDPFGCQPSPWLDKVAVESREPSW